MGANENQEQDIEEMQALGEFRSEYHKSQKFDIAALLAKTDCPQSVSELHSENII